MSIVEQKQLSMVQQSLLSWRWEVEVVPWRWEVDLVEALVRLEVEAFVRLLSPQARQVGRLSFLFFFQKNKVKEKHMFHATYVMFERLRGVVVAV
jgi:hypothetical protein